MKLTSILEQITPRQNSHKLAIPASWHQGRTCYGGLSSAMAYTAAKGLEVDIPPLKSAQISFAGPLAGDIEVTATRLRRGRNTAFIRSDIICGDDIGLSCNFIFMNPRTSQLNHESLHRPDFPPIPTGEDIRSGQESYFTQNLQYSSRQEPTGRAPNHLASWRRLIERDGLDPFAELICIADALPPSAIGMMTEKAMISSMNWQINMLTDAPATKDGWWCLESETHHAANGSSSQYMTVWNTDGEPVMTGMQAVAIFA
jgi:acyl-CoA thioesterase